MIYCCSYLSFNSLLPRKKIKGYIFSTVRSTDGATSQRESYEGLILD